MLGDYFNTVITHIEKSDFGTGYIESAGHKEKNAVHHCEKPKDDTKKAILSIFMGARIHDAAVMIGVPDRTMRDRFLTYCKHVNVQQFERIYEKAVHQGYSTPPVELFQPYLLDFFSQEDISELYGPMNIPSYAKELAEKGLEKAKRELSLARIRLSVVEGMSRIVGCS
ncbi:hypothetical protein ACEWA7_20250 [Vibrio parahaemolyticus]